MARVRYIIWNSYFACMYKKIQNMNFAGYFQPNETFSNLCKSDTKPVTIFLFFTLKFCVIRITWRSTLTTTMVTEVKTGTLKEVVELQLKHTMGSIKFLSSCISYLPNFRLPNASQYNLFFITNHSGINYYVHKMWGLRKFSWNEGLAPMAIEKIKILGAELVLWSYQLNCQFSPFGPFLW